MRIQLDNGKTYILNALQVEIMRYARISHGHWFAPGHRDDRDYIIGTDNCHAADRPAEEKAMRSLARRELLTDTPSTEVWGRPEPTKWYLTGDFWMLREAVQDVLSALGR